MIHNQPPQASIKRMSVYLRHLNHLLSKNVKCVSSAEIATALDLNAAQVRKDLTYLGELGTRGVGYHVKKLRDSIIKLLGLKTIRKIGIIGAAGHLGGALARYPGFEKHNFKVVALFDTQNIGQEVPNVGIIEHIDQINKIVAEREIDIIVLCVPTNVVQEVFNKVQDSGVKAVLNFAPIKLISNKDIHVQNVDFTSELETLSFKLRTINPE